MPEESRLSHLRIIRFSPAPFPHRLVQRTVAERRTVMRKRLIAAALALLAALLPMLRPRAAAPVLEVDAPAAILIEQSTGEILYEKNAHEAMPPASVTKVMTLLLVMEALADGRIGWDDTVTASENAAAKGGSQVYLEPGEQMSMDEMLKSVVVSSANDCAAALAEHVAGSEEAFVSMMNERAAELGMNDTHFVNCTGLDDSPEASAHLTSCHDIALMSRALLNHEEILQYTTIWMDSVRDGKFGLSNTNKLVRFYPGATGLKTGFTSSAGYCLSASASRDGVQFIAVVMHCETSDQRFSAAKALLDYGFANYTLAYPTPQEALPPVAVSLGKAAQVQPMVQRCEGILMEKAAASAVERIVSLPESVEAPVAAGQQLGTLTLKAGETVLAEIPLVAEAAVERLTWYDAALRLLRKICFG